MAFIHVSGVGDNSLGYIVIASAAERSGAQRSKLARELMWSIRETECSRISKTKHFSNMLHRRKNVCFHPLNQYPSWTGPARADHDDFVTLIHSVYKILQMKFPDFSLTSPWLFQAQFGSNRCEKSPLQGGQLNCDLNLTVICSQFGWELAKVMKNNISLYKKIVD